MAEHLGELVVESGQPLLKNQAEAVDISTFPGFQKVFYAVAKADENARLKDAREEAQSYAALQKLYLD